MRKNIFAFILIFSFCTEIAAQEKIFVMENAKQKCIYNIKDGKMTGNFVCYYENGKMQAKGNLINGYRAGLWTVWDTAGIKRMERNYKNIFEFERLLPLIPKEGAIPLLIQNSYKLTYNKDGIVEYAKVRDENILSRHKFWRNVDPKNNEYLFKNNLLFNVIKKLAIANKIELYDVNDDRFTELVKKEQYPTLLNIIDSSIIRFEIKEEAFFDLDKFIIEKRIIGICPIIKEGDKERPLFWAYYPDMRKYFGKEMISSDKIKDKRIKSLDDLFIFRDFASTIIKTTIDNPYDAFLKNYKGVEGNAKAIATLAEEIELRIIVNEHYIWLSHTK